MDTLGLRLTYPSRYLNSDGQNTTSNKDYFQLDNVRLIFSVDGMDSVPTSNAVVITLLPPLTSHCLLPSLTSTVSCLSLFLTISNCLPLPSTASRYPQLPSITATASHCADYGQLLNSKQALSQDSNTCARLVYSSPPPATIASDGAFETQISAVNAVGNRIEIQVFPTVARVNNEMPALYEIVAKKYRFSHSRFPDSFSC